MPAVLRPRPDYNVTMVTRTIRSRLAAFLLAVAASAACRLSAPPAAPASTPPAATPTAFAPLPAASPSPQIPPPTGENEASAPSPAPGQATGFHGLTVPAGWYYTPVEDGELAAAVFTPLDPADLAAFDDPEWMVPPDFAIGALARSPLPEGADPEALLAGMEASLETFSDADLASLLTGAGRIGLINLPALESITVDTAETAILGGRPAIAVRGTAGFGPDTKPGLRILVLLAWTDDSFFTFYGITSDAAWEAFETELVEMMETVELP